MTISISDTPEGRRHLSGAAGFRAWRARISPSSTTSSPKATRGPRLDAAWDAGVRYFDTAPWYGRGLSEHRLGTASCAPSREPNSRSPPRSGARFSGRQDLKTFSREPWTGGLNFEVHFDYSYDGVMRSYEQALQRLALDTVDALVIHDLDVGFHGDEARPP